MVPLRSGCSLARTLCFPETGLLAGVSWPSTIPSPSPPRAVVVVLGLGGEPGQAAILRLQPTLPSTSLLQPDPPQPPTLALSNLPSTDPPAPWLQTPWPLKQSLPYPALRGVRVHPPGPPPPSHLAWPLLPPSPCSPRHSGSQSPAAASVSPHPAVCA